MTEETVTKTILNWLEENKWEIVCYDFPQSGTGVVLHQNEILRTTKNKGSIIPDIVAVKESTAVFFENKDRFLESDFRKIEELRVTPDYQESTERLLKGFEINKLFYGIGIAHKPINIKKIQLNLSRTDFLISCSIGEVTVFYDPNALFL